MAALIRYRNAYNSIGTLLVPMLLAACMQAAPIQLPTTALPALQAANQQTTTISALAQWWQPWNDPVLATLLTRVGQQNTDLLAARARLQQTRRELSFVDRQFLPELHFITQDVVAPNGVDTFFQFGFDATWEMDLYGRKQARQRLGESELLKQAAQTRGLLISLTAEVLRSYLEMQAIAMQSDYVSHWLTINQQLESALEKQQQLGLEDRRARWPMQQAASKMRQQLAELQQQQQDNLWRLTVLSGMDQPDAAWAQRRMTTFPMLSLPSLPLSVLESSPGVMQAQAVVLRTAGELGLAHADLFPSITLTGGYFFSHNVTQNHTLQGEFNEAPAFGPNIDIPLLDLHKRLQHLQAEQSGLRASLLEYQSAVRQAWLDTHHDLLAFAAETAQLKEENQQNTQIQDHTLADRQRLQLGLGTTVTVLEDQLHELEHAVQTCQAQLRYSIAYLAVYKAVGGAYLESAEKKSTPMPQRQPG